MYSIGPTGPPRVAVPRVCLRDLKNLQKYRVALPGYTIGVRFRMALYAYSKRPQGTTRTDQRQAPSVHTQSLSNHKAGASHLWADATVHRTYI